MDEQDAPAQPVTGFLVLTVGFALACYAWPSGIGDVPVDSLTLGMISQALYAACIGIGALLVAGRLWA